MKAIKYISALLLGFIAFTTLGQTKYNYVHFNRLTEVTGTAFVIASVENRGKIAEVKSQYLLFINTETGQTHQVDFPADANIQKQEQIRIDSLAIQVILIAAKTVDLDRKSGIDWSDPTQLFVLTTDGKEKTQLTDADFFARGWQLNRQSGT